MFVCRCSVTDSNLHSVSDVMFRWRCYCHHFFFFWQSHMDIFVCVKGKQGIFCTELFFLKVWGRSIRKGFSFLSLFFFFFSHCRRAIQGFVDSTMGVKKFTCIPSFSSVKCPVVTSCNNQEMMPLSSIGLSHLSEMKTCQQVVLEKARGRLQWNFSSKNTSEFTVIHFFFFSSSSSSPAPPPPVILSFSLSLIFFLLNSERNYWAKSKFVCVCTRLIAKNQRG